MWNLRGTPIFLDRLRWHHPTDGTVNNLNVSTLAARMEMSGFGASNQTSKKALDSDIQFCHGPRFVKSWLQPQFGHPKGASMTITLSLAPFRQCWCGRFGCPADLMLQHPSIFAMCDYSWQHGDTFDLWKVEARSYVAAPDSQVTPSSRDTPKLSGTESLSHSVTRVCLDQLINSYSSWWRGVVSGVLSGCLFAGLCICRLHSPGAAHSLNNHWKSKQLSSHVIQQPEAFFLLWFWLWTRSGTPQMFSRLPFCLCLEHTTRENLRVVLPSFTLFSIFPNIFKSIGLCSVSLLANQIAFLTFCDMLPLRWVRQVRWFTQPGKRSRPQTAVGHLLHGWLGVHLGTSRTIAEDQQVAGIGFRPGKGHDRIDTIPSSHICNLMYYLILWLNMYCDWDDCRNMMDDIWNIFDIWMKYEMRFTYHER